MAVAALPRLPDSLFEEEQPMPVLAQASAPQPVQKKSSNPAGIFVHVGGYESQHEALALSQSLSGVTESPANPLKVMVPNLIP